MQFDRFIVDLAAALRYFYCKALTPGGEARECKRVRHPKEHCEKKVLNELLFLFCEFFDSDIGCPTREEDRMNKQCRPAQLASTDREPCNANRNSARGKSLTLEGYGGNRTALRRLPGTAEQFYPMLDFGAANGSRDFTPADRSAAPPQRCSCGGSCDKCSRMNAAEEDIEKVNGKDPQRKSLGGTEDDELALLGSSAPKRGEEQDGLPHSSAATVVCDGAGGYRVQLNSWAGSPCGIEACISKHEESHASDWRGRWPQGCKDKADGAAIPTGGPGYPAFLKQSECTAYTTEIPCEEAALAAATGDCKAKCRLS